MQTNIKALLVMAAVGSSVVACPALAVETAEPIRVILIDSSDADFIAYSFGTILAEIGYNVEFVRVDYTAQIPALETGDVDVSTAIWDTSSWPALNDAVSAGNVLNFGSTGVQVLEGWWYPSYVAELCPGLPDWTALKEPDCVQALATIETEPRGRYVDAPADWETDAQTRMDALGIDFEAMNSGSPVTLIATIKAAVDKQEPIIGWGYIPHWYFEKIEGEFVQLPPNADACYDDPAHGPNPDEVFDCGYSAGYVWKLGSAAFQAKAPDAARYLHLMSVSTSDVAEATDRIENGGEAIEDVAAEWVEAHRDAWTAWIR
ncbi:ABC transporter substrate-binding protein [Tropicimonas marinistellae]|uniref:ABC transporter substrate-binding protein n=1 Tax=Tropicimonas marinistellae TaxID=1739787 RepID=UPI00082FC060|nr:ABC transporter substrate-binding protein [Tropicimonas marinistellae]